MRITRFIALAPLVAVWLMASAQGGVVVWNPGPDGPPILLPASTAGQPGEDVRAYLAGVNGSKDLAPLREGLGAEHKLTVPEGESLALDRLPDSPRPRFVVLANEFEDLLRPPAGKRMLNVVKQLKAAGAEVYVVPVSADIAASPEAAREFRRELAAQFDGMLALGGADVDPALYGEKITHARALTPVRDASELATIREFVAAEHGVMYGICRGHQICGVAQGHRLIQDIPTETVSQTNHGKGMHKIHVKKGSLLHQFAGNEEIEVNSFHHQAVIAKPDSPVMIVGESLEEGVSIVESAEFRNGLGLTFQFHPELMNDAHGKAIMKGMVDYASKIRLAHGGLGCPTAVRGLVRHALLPR